MSKSTNILLAGVLAAALALSGCASHPTSPRANAQEEDYGIMDESDPLEPMNRFFFSFNRGVDSVILRPVSSIYRGVVPQAGRDGVHNFLLNLTSPVILVNAVLQHDGKQAFTTFWRFVLNTTFGFGGLRDFAGENGLPYRNEDFGQTLGFYGVNSGPYLVLPLLGPSSLRDTAGLVVDYATDPITYLANEYWNVGRAGAEAVDFRSRNMKTIDDIFNNSVDPYAMLRSAYLQKRDAEVRNNVVRSPLGN